MEKRSSLAEGTSKSIFAADQRHSARHGVHSPAYVSVSGSSPGAITDLAQVVNISESGICVQFTTPMEASRLLPLCLELSATDARIYEVGHVVWSDLTGKTGIRLPETSEVYRTQLQGWLKVNAEAEVPTTLDQVFSAPAAIAAGNLRHKDFSPDLEPALGVITQQALTLTRATGAAIALLDHDGPSEMICRARAGVNSPEIGARLQTGSGFSGECVRTGEAIICDDAEHDPRVERGSSRALGVRSILAVPIKQEGCIVGVIEIFSPEPHAFTHRETAVLRRLAGFATSVVQCSEFGVANVIAIPWLSAHAESASGEGELHSFDPAAFEATAFEPAASEPAEILSSPPSPRYKIVFISSGIACLLAAVWMLAPTFARWRSSAVNLAPSAQASSQDDYVFKTISDLTAQANQGDAGAQYELAMRYANGTDVTQDYREAREWFLRAAEQGHLAAEGKVAAAFWEGQGGAQDYSKAYFWALLAQAGGDELSRQIVISSAARLSPFQIAAEQKEADEWLHSHRIGHGSDSTALK